MTPKQLKEKLAAIEHKRWASWQQWVFHQYGVYNKDGSFTISADRVENMERQINLPYAELTRKEQESDLAEVDRYWPLIVKFADQAYKEGVKAAKEGQE